MTSRDRILSSINHKQPDKVPVDIGATPSSGISVVAYQNLIKHLGMNHLKTHVYDVIQEVVQPEMEFLDHVGHIHSPIAALLLSRLSSSSLVIRYKMPLIRPFSLG